MNIYACNVCHYIFKAEHIPESCPDCHAKAATGHADTGRSFTLGAVRPASEEELKEYEKTVTAISPQKSFIDRLDHLQEYELTDDEYHMALMLLFFFKNIPADYAIPKLDNILSPSFMPDPDSAETAIRNLYSDAKRHFTSELGAERRSVGTNDVMTVSYYAGKDSAASILLRFRQSEVDNILGKTPNLTEVRNVHYDDIVKQPSKEYLRFLVEWQNSLK